MSSKKSEFAPIVFFVYSRLFHTRRTLEALAENTLARKSNLYIFADGAQNPNMEIACSELKNYLRTYIKENKGKTFKNITLIERPYNFGLAENISQGVTEIVNMYGRVIVVEDDILTSPHALNYLNQALDFYENEKEVFHIAGWNDILSMQGIKEDAFLWRAMNCWLWATWKDRWDYFHMDADKMFSHYSKKDIYGFNRDNSDTIHWGLAQGVKNGHVHTWDIYWYGAIFNQKGLCLNPVESLARNIGTDYSGTHCDENIGLLSQHISDKKEWFFPTEIKENALAFAQIKKFNIKEKEASHAMRSTIARSEYINEQVLLFRKTIEEAQAEFSTHTMSQKSTIKDKLRKWIKHILVALWPPYNLLEITRIKAMQNEARIDALQERIVTLELWEKATSFPLIKKYANKSGLLAHHNNSTPHQIEAILLYIEKKKPKVVLEIGSGVSTTLLAAAQATHRGFLLSIDHNKAKTTEIRNILSRNKLERYAHIYETQLNFQNIAGLDWITYDMRYFSEIAKPIDLLILDDTTGYIQKNSLAVLAMLLEPYIKKTTVLDASRLSGDSKKILPLLQEYFPHKGKSIKCL